MSSINLSVIQLMFVYIYLFSLVYLFRNIHLFVDFNFKE